MPILHRAKHISEVHAKLLRYKAELLESGPELDCCILQVDEVLKIADRDKAFTCDNILVPMDILSQQLLEVEAEDRCRCFAALSHFLRCVLIGCLHREQAAEAAAPVRHPHGQHRCQMHFGTMMGMATLRWAWQKNRWGDPIGRSTACSVRCCMARPVAHRIGRPAP